jgi:parvulin-like peptidyl-prolyl isomerase
MVKYFFTFFILTILLNAQIINRIAIKVNSEIITDYDISEAVLKMHVGRKKVINRLIEEILVKDEIEKYSITVSEEEINKYISNIMQRTHIPNRATFLQYLAQQNITEDEFRNDIKKQLLTLKLRQKIVQSKLIEPTEKELKEFYRNNIDQYKMAKKYNLKIYSSYSPKAIQQKRFNIMLNLPNVAVENGNFSLDKLPSEIAQNVIKLKEGEYSEIFPYNQQYMFIYLNKKIDVRTLKFEEVKNSIREHLLLIQQNEILKKYFERIRNKAIIEKL